MKGKILMAVGGLLLVGLGVTLAAKRQPSLEGTWISIDRYEDMLVFEGSTMTNRWRNEDAVVSTMTTGRKAGHNTIDFTHNGLHERGIYAIEDDILLLSVRGEAAGPRPSRLGHSKESRISFRIYQRAEAGRLP